MRYDTLTGPQAWLRVSYFRCSRGIPESDQSLLGSLTDWFHQKSPFFGYVAKKEPEKEALW